MVLMMLAVKPQDSYPLPDIMPELYRRLQIRGEESMEKKGVAGKVGISCKLSLAHTRE